MLTNPASSHCPVCDRPLEHWIAGSTQGAYCPACRRWDVVTTYMPPILADRTIYRVLAAPVAQPSAAQVRAVARASGSNFLQTKQALTTASIALVAARAEVVLAVVVALDMVGVAHTVEPTFRWTAADAPEAVWAASPRPAQPRDPLGITPTR